jgi:hypothetical protein
MLGLESRLLLLQPISSYFFNIQGTLDKEVYMTLPLGYENNSNKNLMYKLKKSIYDLK